MIVEIFQITFHIIIKNNVEANIIMIITHFYTKILKNMKLLVIIGLYLNILTNIKLINKI